jgi:hypothetical protein
MKYELTYICVNCDTRWSEIVSADILREVFNGKYEIMTKDWLYLLFKYGMEMHICDTRSTTSYGNVVSIRPIREEE